MVKNRVVVVGAGAGGLSTLNRLKRRWPQAHITVIEPNAFHYYQPAWTLVSMGLYSPSATQKPMEKYIPSDVTWKKSKVVGVDPQAQKVHLHDGEVVPYDYLILAPGLCLNWDAYENVKENLGQNGVACAYDLEIASRVPQMVQSFEKGIAIFIHPVAPIKCAGAPQKVMYMFEHLLRLKGVRSQAEIIFVTAGPKLFGIPIFNATLEKIVRERNIKVYFQHVLVGIDSQRKTAKFRDLTSQNVVELPYDFIHVVPPQKAPSFIRDSGLAWNEGPHTGWLAVDKETLQHVQFPNIFGVGDVTGIPNAKTGAAVRKQYPIVVENLLAVAQGQKPTARYNGYSSCPLITEVGKVMLAEFGYNDQLLPTFPVDPSKPRRSFWYLKKYVLPILYWQFMLKGVG